MIKETVRNYSVDTEGNIFNKSGKKKATFINNHGYEVVFLWENNKAKSHSVHRLVAEAFLPNPENKPCVNHKDGNKANNILDNLEWCTYSENTLHALENNLKVPEQGEDVHNAIISNIQAHEICQLMEKGYRDFEIQKIVKVSRDTLSNIRHGKGWLSISSNYKIPKKSTLLSEETIRWICEQIEKGLKNKDIVLQSNNPKVSKSLVTQIKNKKVYRHISYLYNF